MNYTDSINRLEAAGPDAWAVYRRAMRMKADGGDIVELAIGEPDMATPDFIVEATIDALRNDRTKYAPTKGEPGLRRALAERYSKRTGREITPNNILAFPGTQGALYSVLRAVVGPGDDLLVGDPMYATYTPVAAACGANIVPVPLRAERGFHLDAADLSERVTPNSTAVLLNTPHNPTGAVLSKEDVTAIGAVAIEHDLWLIVDEVYEEMLFGGNHFYSPLDDPALAERVVSISSISKSHAAPGFRSGWCVAPLEFCEKTVRLTEAVSFGNQPFIADATALAVSSPSPIAQPMARRFEARAGRLASALHRDTKLTVHSPEAGMFSMINVSSTGMDSTTYAYDLLEKAGVAIMPGASFGSSIDDWVRVALTSDDASFDEGISRITAHATA